MVSGSPIEKMLERNKPRLEERNWMVRRRRPAGLRSSEMGFLDVCFLVSAGVYILGIRISSSWRSIGESHVEGSGH
jgi:hypothetical protein